MAIIKAINSKSSVKDIINYVTDKEKTTEELMYGKDCSSEPSQAIEDMQTTKELYGKTEGRQYKHFVQSFSPEDKITPEKANQLGKEWAKENFEGYEVFIATHTDKDHIHNHFIINSVNFETGEKYRQSRADLKRYKEISNKLCQREGLSLSEPKKDILTSYNMKEYKALEKGSQGQYESYKLELWKNINICRKIATSKEEFISLMNKKGYQVKWSDSRKYITYVPPKGRPIRDSNLAKAFKNEKLSKEGLLNEFERNGEKFRDRGTTGDNRKVIRDTKDIGKAIIFGKQLGGNEVYCGRDDKLVEVNQTEQREPRAIDKTTTPREEVSRADVSRPNSEIGQDNSRNTTGNGRLEGKQLSSSKDFDRNTDEGQEDNRGLNRYVSRDIEEHKGHGEGENMERQSNSIFDTTRGDSRTDINDSRSLQPNNLLDKIVSRFAKPLKKVEEKKKAEEKAKAELEKKQKNTTKSKPIRKNWTPDR